ncbi:MAG: hypothetical protein AB1758_23245 [Candidatus Eremiobacterota bacterium]
MLILSCLSVVLVGVIPATLIGLKGASERATATDLVQNTLQTLRMRDLAQLYPSTTVATVDGVKYTITVQPGDPPVAGQEKVARQVTVEVTWNSKRGPARFTAATILQRSQF